MYNLFLVVDKFSPLQFQAVMCFVILAYIHNAFSRTPINCLDHVKDTWPRDGILRVVIARGSAVSRLSDTEIPNSTTNSTLSTLHSNSTFSSEESENNYTLDMYNLLPDGKPEKNQLPVRDTVVPNSFELMTTKKGAIYIYASIDMVCLSPVGYGV